MVELQKIDDCIDDAIISLRYATDDNVTKRKLYAMSTAALRKDVLKALQEASQEFRKNGYRIVIWDAYRPPGVQRELRAVCDDENYVAVDSNHCKGITVDMTLATSAGDLIDMGTDHDEFSERAHAKSHLITEQQTANREMLQRVMRKHGFRQLPTEWWHFDFIQGLDADFLNIKLEDI